jgi:hypothetical protein
MRHSEMRKVLKNLLYQHPGLVYEAITHTRSLAPSEAEPPRLKREGRVNGLPCCNGGHPRAHKAALTRPGSHLAPTLKTQAKAKGKNLRLSGWVPPPPHPNHRSRPRPVK